MYFITRHTIFLFLLHTKFSRTHNLPILLLHFCLDHAPFLTHTNDIYIFILQESLRSNARLRAFATVPSTGAFLKYNFESLKSSYSTPCFLSFYRNFKQRPKYKTVYSVHSRQSYNYRVQGLDRLKCRPVYNCDACIQYIHGSVRSYASYHQFTHPKCTRALARIRANNLVDIGHAHFNSRRSICLH